ncbi:transcriptional regulator/antitoxin, MazE [Deinococcus aerius]|uniref:Transcriptional regulator/antitoxin, MazE n=1 Tax=Deinococcus aerius TaxID=200253 RepID=A0A2I9DTG0_9DEIO|nr:AbrB/MazE/SpoVT family DNA-binding domain-containing protein [Deinococcus aerius]GBF05907.1 transcriptional regulator/antitoxin, MazE [Deinococcus aerius]
MRKRLTAVGKSRAVILPKELLELYGFTDEVEIEPAEGGLMLRPARKGMSFEEAADRVFEERDELLRRLSQA